MRKLILAALLISGRALATPHGPGTPLPDWQCALLNATEAQMMDPLWTGPPILAAPQPNAPVLGTTSAILFIAKPTVEQNGYLKTLRLNGQVGWIRADAVKPYRSVSNPYAVCRVVRYPDGSVGSAGL